MCNGYKAYVLGYSTRNPANACLPLAFNNLLLAWADWKPGMAIWHQWQMESSFSITSCQLPGTWYLVPVSSYLAHPSRRKPETYVRSTNELWFFLPSAEAEWSDCKSMRLASIKCHKRHNKPSVRQLVLPSVRPSAIRPEFNALQLTPA